MLALSLPGGNHSKAQGFVSRTNGPGKEGLVDLRLQEWWAALVQGLLGKSIFPLGRSNLPITGIWGTWWILSPWALGIIEVSSIVLRELGSCRVVQVHLLLPYCWMNRVGLSTRGKSSGDPEHGNETQNGKISKN